MELNQLTTMGMGLVTKGESTWMGYNAWNNIRVGLAESC